MPDCTGSGRRRRRGSHPRHLFAAGVRHQVLYRNRGDGLPDLFVTALANETFPLFRNLGRALFRDVIYTARVARAVLSSTGWGNGIFDFNNDGHKDLFAANGDVQDNTERYSSRSSRQRPEQP